MVLFHAALFLPSRSSSTHALHLHTSHASHSNKVESITAVADNEFSIDISNPLNDYESRSAVTVRASDLVDTDNERAGQVNFVVKWEGAQKQSTLAVMAADDKALKPKKKGSPGFAPRPLTAAGEWTPVLAVDCRGLEPSGFNVGVDEFTVVSCGGSTFSEEVDFSDDWCEYCEKNEGAVSVNGVSFRWTAL